MHKYRYYASLDRSPNMRPPVCLRYAMWTLAASITPKYQCFESIMYERARRYIQQDEMKVCHRISESGNLLISYRDMAKHLFQCITYKLGPLWLLMKLQKRFSLGLG